METALYNSGGKYSKKAISWKTEMMMIIQKWSLVKYDLKK
jgi:hypothetical protein